MHDLYLLYGATFLGAGMLLAFQARMPRTILPRFGLWCLAGFGLLHGLSEWTQMEVVGPGPRHADPALKLAGLTLGTLSFALLSQFAVTVLVPTRWRWFVAVPTVLAIAWCVIMATMPARDNASQRVFDALSRYLFGLPASLLAAWSLRRLHRERPKGDRIATYLGWASWCFVAYALTAGVIVAPAPFFPASHLHSDAFREVMHVPIEIFRTACAVGIAVCLSEAFVMQAARDHEELEHRREEFVSIVAHDLRGPIGTIGLAAEMLEHQLSGLEEVAQQQARKLVRNIRTGANGLERMVRDLLDASRIETNMLTLEKRPVELRSLVGAIIDRASAATRDHAVRAALPKNLPMVQADPVRVEQILVNLLSNAAKYSKPASEITIEATARPTEIEVAVTNQGAGVSPEESKRLFSRFYRSKQHVREIEGLGLGLYIVKGLVDAHGGHVWVDSEPGRSTTFRFTLPCPDVPQAGEARGQPDAEHASSAVT